MKKLLLLLLLTLPTYAAENIYGWCTLGGTPVLAPPAVAATPVLIDVQQSFPFCNVSVYITGSGGTLATIYQSNGGILKTNPFQADQYGFWSFYAANGTYDVQISGGGMTSPYTFPAIAAFDVGSYTPSIPFSSVTSGTNNQTLTLSGTLQTTSAGIINFGVASSTTPWLLGNSGSLPGACSVGQVLFATNATAGQNLFVCTSSNTWTQYVGSGGGGGGGFLPLTGGTMTGVITTAAVQGAVYVPFGGGIQMQVGPSTGQNPMCTSGFGNCPDSTLVDYFGFEGNFFRIKGGGDYFDWTRWGSGTSALPLHQVNLNDSSFNTLLNVDETVGYPNVKFNFTGFINASQQIQSSQGMLAPIYRLSNGSDYFDWTNSGIGTHHFQFRDSGNNPIVDYNNQTANWQTGTLTVQGQIQTNLTSSYGVATSILRISNSLDYFDLTNYSLGTHAFNLYDSGHNALLGYANTTTNWANGVFTFNGEVSTNVLNPFGFQASIYRLNNGQDYFDFINYGLGTHSFNLQDSSSNAILTYRNMSGSGSGGTFTVSGNLTVTGTCTGCGGGGGSFTGGTLTSQLILENPVTTTTGNCAGGWCVGALYLPYGSNLEMQVGPATGQSTTCTLSSCIDATLIDYAGFEGNFFRIKGGGDYFDWTRWTAGTSALPLHQVNFNNSSFATLLHVDDSFGAGQTQFNFTGYINATQQIADVIGMKAPIFKLDNGSDYFEWINTGLSTHHFEIQDSGSNPVLDYANGSGMWDTGTFTFNGNVTVTGTCTGCAPAGSGVTAVTPTSPIVASISGSTLSVSCPTCGAGAGVSSITGTANQVIASAATGAVTLRLPQDMGTSSILQFAGVMINQAYDGLGYRLEVNGGEEIVGQNTLFFHDCTVNNCVNVASGGVTAGTGYWVGGSKIIGGDAGYVGAYVNVPGVIQSNVTGVTVGIQVNGGTFQVLGNGTTGAANFNVGAGGTIQFNGSPGLRFSGGQLQYSNNGGVVWNNFSTLGGVSSVTAGTGVTVNPTTGNVVVSNTGVTFLQGSASMVNVSANTGTVTLSLPQSIATTSAPTFAGVTATSFVSNAGGATASFQNGAMQILGNGQIGTNAFVNAVQGYYVNGVQMINSSGQGLFTGINVGSGGISAGDFIVAGGFIGQTWNVTIPGMTIAGVGCTNGLVFRGGILVSCF